METIFSVAFFLILLSIYGHNVQDKTKIHSAVLMLGVIVGIAGLVMSNSYFVSLYVFAFAIYTGVSALGVTKTSINPMAAILGSISFMAYIVLILSYHNVGTVFMATVCGVYWLRQGLRALPSSTK